MTTIGRRLKRIVRAGVVRPPLPDFLILGAMKAGTSSLYAYLTRHPRVVAATAKELHYFSRHSMRGDEWYRQQFPPRLQSWACAVLGKPRLLTGEATPYYLFHPHAPRRAARLVPWAKLIVLLRDPVARTHSHYHHERRLGFESLPFEEALAVECERLRGEVPRMLSDPTYYSFNHHHFAYAARSRYAPQIERWLEHFDRRQFLFLRSEDLYASPGATVARVFDFLGVPSPDFHDTFPVVNANSYPPLDPSTRRDLAERFRPDNERLYALLDRDFGWDAVSAAP